MWRAHHAITMQRLWDVLSALDIVFQANVLAKRLCCGSEDDKFGALRSKIDAVAIEIETELIS